MTKSLSNFLQTRLAASGISEKDAAYAGIRAATKAEALKLYPSLPEHLMTASGFLIPYSKKFARLRQNPAGAIVPLRYLQPPATGCQLYFPKVKGCDWDAILKDKSIPVRITEGELKALALTLAGYPTIGLGGVDSFVYHKVMLEQLAAYVKGRTVYIVYDSDARSKPGVCAAIERVSTAILKEDGLPMVVNVPFLSDDEFDRDKTGADTFLRVMGKDEYAKLEAEADEYDLAKVMLRLNSEYVFCESPLVVIRLVPKDKSNLQQWNPPSWASLVECRDEVPRLNADGKTYQRAKAGKFWLSSYKGINLVNGVTFLPGAERYINDNSSRLLNFWSGWGATPVRNDDLVKPYLELLRHVVSREKDPKLCLKYLLSWQSYQLKHPGEKLEQSLSLVGAQGSGKSLPHRIYGALHGRGFLTITEDELNDPFNDWLANRTYIVGEEITGEGNSRKYATRLKVIITQDEVLINTKFVPKYTLPNLANYGFAMNDPDGLFLGDTRERRYFVVGTPDAMLTDEERGLGLAKVRYLDETFRKDSDCLNALMYFLLNFEIDESVYRPKGLEPPMTLAKEHMMHQSENTAASWLRKFEPNGHTLFRSEELCGMYLTQRGSDTSCGARAFANALPRRFYKPLGDRTIRGCTVWEFRDGKRAQVEKEINLWALKPDCGGTKDYSQLTGAQLRAIWNKENQQ